LAIAFEKNYEGNTMKKTAFFIISLLIILLLTGCHEHVWNEATCLEPKTCKKCGETEGEPLGHEWIEATFTEPMTCSRCGDTEGEPKSVAYFDLTFLEYMEAFNDQFAREISLDLIENDGVYINANGVKFLTLHDDEHANDNSHTSTAVWGLGTEGEFNRLIVRYFLSSSSFDTSFASIFTNICCNYAFNILDPEMSSEVFYQLAETKNGKDLNGMDYVRAGCEHNGYRYEFEWSDNGFGYSTRYWYQFEMTIADN